MPQGLGAAHGVPSPHALYLQDDPVHPDAEGPDDPAPAPGPRAFPQRHDSFYIVPAYPAPQPRGGGKDHGYVAVPKLLPAQLRNLPRFRRIPGLQGQVERPLPALRSAKIVEVRHVASRRISTPAREAHSAPMEMKSPTKMNRMSRVDVFIQCTAPPPHTIWYRPKNALA